MAGITTHVLDTSTGRPATDVKILLEVSEGGSWFSIGQGATDSDGRLRTLLGDRAPSAGIYRITFDTGDYFASRRLETFFPSVAITFDVKDGSQHYHVPLLISPYGYSTYRGS